MEIKKRIRMKSYDGPIYTIGSFIRKPLIPSASFIDFCLSDKIPEGFTNSKDDFGYASTEIPDWAIYSTLVENDVLFLSVSYGYDEP